MTRYRARPGWSRRGWRDVVRALLASFLLLGLAACDYEVPASTDRPGTWTYVTGPHGEHCLFWSDYLGTKSGTAAMSCDGIYPTSTPG
jgi:hypothetical protein